VTRLRLRLRGVLIAFFALALSTGLAFGAQPASSGLPNASSHAGKTLPVRVGDSDTAGDEDADEGTDAADETDDSADAGDNCTTDPTALTTDALEAMRHGSIVCWAAQQVDWPEWFANRGSFVRCWAQQGRPDAPSCTEDPATEQPAGDDTVNGRSHGAGHGNGKGKGHNQ
jgi:hypothetical protein